MVHFFHYNELISPSFSDSLHGVAHPAAFCMGGSLPTLSVSRCLAAGTKAPGGSLSAGLSCTPSWTAWLGCRLPSNLQRLHRPPKAPEDAEGQEVGISPSSILSEGSQHCSPAALGQNGGHSYPDRLIYFLANRVTSALASQSRISLFIAQQLTTAAGFRGFKSHKSICSLLI